MQEFIELLKGVRPDIDWENSTSLVDDNVLDSLDIISIISEVSDEYDIQIPPEAIVNENFNSAKALKALVDKLVEEQD